MISPDERNLYEDALKRTELQATQERVNSMQNQSALEQDDKSMIREQLDLEDEIVKIEKLLRGYVLTVDKETGESYWDDPDDKDMVVLSDYGVQLILDVIAWYLNKNTLLSNYEESRINEKMEDFANDLNDDIFMSYEKVFRYPTLEECKSEIKRRIAQKVELRKFASDLANQDLSEQEIEDSILKEMEGTIERELNVIREQKMKDKLKKFSLIMRKVQDSVHSTFLRAWKGQERTTLRQHIHISETKGNMPQPQHNTGGTLGLFGKR